MRESVWSGSRVCLLLNKEQVIFHLPTELDGGNLLTMPATEGDVVVVDIPVTSFYLS